MSGSRKYISLQVKDRIAKVILDRPPVNALKCSASRGTKECI